MFELLGCASTAGVEICVVERSVGMQLDCWGVVEESEFGPDSVDRVHQLWFPLGSPTGVRTNVPFCVKSESQVRKSAGKKCRGSRRSGYLGRVPTHV
jgi:hypothetical protein